MDMTEQKNDFGVGSVEQNIIRMAVPMTVAQILNLLYNLVDRMYIGHIPGASSLALTLSLIHIYGDGASASDHEGELRMVKVIGVRFRQAGKIYYFSPGKLKIRTGDHVIVETARGLEYGLSLIHILDLPFTDSRSFATCFMASFRFIPCSSYSFI